MHGLVFLWLFSSLTGHSATVAEMPVAPALPLKRTCVSKIRTLAASRFKGNSVLAKRVRSLLARVAPYKTSVLLEGETGTGKEIAAREIHRLSPRAKKPFVALNMAGLSGGLVDSELFGHVLGAFTGALQDRIGAFERANGGTLFLDEITEMPIGLQSKLLRVLENHEVQVVGGDIRPVDVRVIAATNVPLKQALQSGKLREDLYYRLSVMELRLPPLRERSSDIAPLANHFLEATVKRYGLGDKTFSPEALAALTAYLWPGNVRELKHTVEATAVLSDGAVIHEEDLPKAITAPHFLTLEEAIKQHTLKTLAECDFRVSRAAKALGKGRLWLVGKLEEWDLR